MDARVGFSVSSRAPALLAHYIDSAVLDACSISFQVVGYLREELGVRRLAVHGESIGGIAAASVARNCQVGWMEFHCVLPAACFQRQVL